MVRKIPEILYHGSFLPKGKDLDPNDRLIIANGYISTSEYRIWAEYFARIKASQFPEETGLLRVYIIHTDQLLSEVIEGCILPGKFDPRAGVDSNIRKVERDLRNDRIRMGEWRFPYIPLEATRWKDNEVKSPLSYFYQALLLYKPA